MAQSAQAENVIPASKQGEETAFIHRHLSALATQKKKLPDDFVPAERKRPKRASIATIPVVAPPTPVYQSAASSNGDAAVHVTSVTLSIKSAKPVLAYTLQASPTASILSLKEQLAAENGTGAPPADAQRWVLGGKAMADNKLLNEYSVAEGDKIFLMVQKGWTPLAQSPSPAAPVAPPVGSLAVPPPIPSPAPLPLADFPSTASGSSSPKVGRSGHIRVPSLTLERADSSESIHKRGSPVLTAIDTSTPSAPHPSPVGVSQAFIDAISGPTLWTDTLASLRSRLPDEESARRMFEAWLGATKPWLTPSQISRIRDQTGIRGMAGY